MDSVKISEQIGNKEAFESQERMSYPYAAPILPETVDTTSFIEPGVYRQINWLTQVLASSNDGWYQ